MKSNISVKQIVPLLSQRYKIRRDFKVLKKIGKVIDPLISPKIQALSGHGIHIKTNIPQGNGEVLDFCGQTVTCILGQNDPWVSANIVANTLNDSPSFLSTTMGQDLYYTLPERILKISKMGKDCYINHRLNNGSDANDFAVNLAYFYHNEDKKKRKLIAFKGSYHGQGHLLYAISDLETFRNFFDGVKVAFLNAPSHSEHLKTDALTKNDRDILKSIEEMSKDAFGVIIEPIQFNNNGNTCSKAFLTHLRALCTKLDLPLIYDEIQSGWGWLGKMTAAEKYGVWPDIMCLSKSITAGYGPLSVVIAKNAFQNVDVFGARTNGSDVRSLVASHAVMDRLLGTRDVPERIKSTQLGKELSVGLLHDFHKKHTFLLKEINKMKKAVNANSQSIRIGRIKGDGLARLIEIQDRDGKFDSKLTTKLQNDLLMKGRVFVRTPSNHDEIHTLYIKMPIVATPEEMEQGFSRMTKVMIDFIP